MQRLQPTLFNKMVEMRRALHRHPELSGSEWQTAEKIAAFLDDLELDYHMGVGGHGLVVDLPGPVGVRGVALRADTDALPICEETQLPFASEVEGVMHACGHDGHTSMLLGAAALLAKDRDLPAPVRLIFQPAEETATGAKAVIESGVLENIGFIFGGHLDRHYPLGTIVVHDGAVNASSDRFCVTIAGRGGHAARPHETVDAVVVGSLLVTAIQTIVSREMNPAHPSVVTVGRFDAGTASNVIAEHAVLEGSIRAQHPEVREHLHRSLRRVCDAIGQLHGAMVTVEIDEGTPALINDVQATALARNAAQDIVDPSRILPMVVANMGGEDFSYYMEQVPGCYVRFGYATEGLDHFPAHSSRYDFDEKALEIGALYYHAIAHAAGQHLSGAITS